MRNLILIITLAIIMHESALAQPCLPNGISFTTQAQIDNFQINYPNCTEIGGNVEIGDWSGNSNITNLNGLSVITSIGGYLDIISNYSLTNLTGLANLTSIGGYLEIYDNTSLQSIASLSNLTSVGESIDIYDNSVLASLTGLDNINAASITDLWICRNPSLSNCNVQAVCNYLSSPNGEVVIYDNAIGCINPSEIANSCGVTLPCLPFGRYYFLFQSDVDNFQTNYPGCTNIEGDVFIGGYGDATTVVNLDGLSQMTSISGELMIMNNPLLTNISGLSNVTSVGGSAQIVGNNSLTSMTGLENLTSIGGFFWMVGDPVLTNLEALSNLTSIGGDLWVTNMDGLTSLAGLDNITANTIVNLYINNSDSLAICEVQSICDYLANPGGTVTIKNNALGCSNRAEVEAACAALGTPEINFESQLLIYPNPASKEIILTATNGSVLKEIKIYDQFGQIVLNNKRINQPVNISMLSPGMYVVEVVADDLKIRRKLIMK